MFIISFLWLLLRCDVNSKIIIWLQNSRIFATTRQIKGPVGGWKRTGGMRVKKHTSRVEIHPKISLNNHIDDMEVIWEISLGLREL